MAALYFKPDQELTFDTVMQNKRRLQVVLASAEKASVHVDMTGVKACDSAGLAFLIEAKKMCIKRGLRCDIEGMTPDLMALAQFSDVMQVVMDGHGALG